jgi:glycosyltransferase involved in cell wall biosynthesis
MGTATAPLVNVVIPVYNGERHLATAIASVLGQTYPRWDLTILNNASTDRTLAIAQEFAARDARIRIHTNPQLINVVANHNKAFTLVTEDAKYVKILGADDWLFPNCLDELVRVAEAHPSVGMVTSYALRGRWVIWDGLPYPSTFLTGREACRLRFLRNLKIFGGPSASLIRTDIVRAKHPFYNPLNYHGDTEAYLELLQRYDFGFVHQVLSYARSDEDSRTTTYLQRVRSYAAEDLDEVIKFGPIYLTPEEHAALRRKATRTYYRVLAWSALEFRGREFWDYHLRHLKAMGYRVSRARLAVYVLGEALLNPFRPITSAARWLGRQLRAASAAAQTDAAARS